jgi:hypothetical protein
VVSEEQRTKQQQSGLKLSQLLHEVSTLGAGDKIVEWVEDIPFVTVKQQIQNISKENYPINLPPKSDRQD